MVQPLNVAKFMKEHVADQIRGKKQKLAVDTDVLKTGATGPTGGLASNGCLFVWDSRFQAYIPEPRNQMRMGLLVKPGV